MVVSEVKLNRVAVAGAIAALAALGVSAPQALSQSALIEIDGSSTVFPISEAMAEDFMAANQGSQVVVGVSGTGGGFRRFCEGETDISNASRPIKDSEKEACAAAGIEFIEIPVAYDALTVVVNPDNTWAQEMTVEQLKMLWEPDAEGTITRWNQIDPSWPNQPINLFGPGTDSGTFDYFTEEIVGEAGASRADYTASEDDNILVVGVERDRNALGYFGMSYYLENQERLNAVAIDGVYPTPANVESGSYTPLSRPLYIYVSRASLEKPEVRSFVQYYLNNAEDIVPEIGYVPLPSAQYSEGLAAL
ncbi:PstS family phosphate ABC transporter substrate-binding protein [Pseudanabaena sp. FACHB-2040]|uniref:PstS family phosphate ABC transporter substrate-binding protein n=1 Tax=Pseudanabaena sp. FACHB-2040 TaxID=2692859 RepID=UPI0016833045|nr:PstS family phosphate ABC transporter substrate-binding protein [Pseudanabaena sp. FACHB-2040]MBD2260266.1 PstS family phosphate ABC transporter substrate-binding protein [Pseudanabaena sp. FACHB-2040]